MDTYVSYTNFPNGITSFGKPVFGSGVLGSLPTQGNVFFVKPVSGSDTSDGRTPYTAFKTLSAALSAATANQNDIVYLMAEGNASAATTAYLSAALDWNKDLVHLIGVGANPLIGQRARIAQLSTVKTIEDLFTVSADGCIIANIAVYQGVASSTATSPRALVVSGERNHFINCSIAGNGDTGGSTDTAGARSLAITGAENTFTNCYIGLDTVIRATQTAEVTVGDIARTTFDNCLFNTYTSLSTFKMVTYSAPDRFVLFKNCILNAAQNITSAVAPTGALEAATSVNGQILFVGSCVTGFGDITTADDTKVYVSSPSSNSSVLVGMGVAGTVDVS